MKKLLLFDIDGTLVLTGRAGARAMWLAARDCFSLAEEGPKIPMAGRTDAWIVAQIAERAGVDCDADTVASFRRCYLDHLAHEIHQPGPRKGVLPGVGGILDAVSGRADVGVGLLTGNFEEGAEIKLAYFDLWRYFAGGAFGDTHQERNRLLGVALDRFEAATGVRLQPSDVVVIGDTPLDVAVAAASGARSLGMATGDYSCEELRACGADHVLPDFSDVAAALKALQL